MNTAVGWALYWANITAGSMNLLVAGWADGGWFSALVGIVSLTAAYVVRPPVTRW